MLNRVKIVAVAVAGAVVLSVSVVVAVLTIWQSAPHPSEPVVAASELQPGLQAGG